MKQHHGGNPHTKAPEVILRQRHEASVDYYALGVILYECMLQKDLPMPSHELKVQRLKNGVLKQIKVEESDVPEGWSSDAADFINNLI